MTERTFNQSPDDATLFHAYQRGDVAAFEQLYTRHRKPLFAFLLRHSRQPHAEVEELFQEIWLKVIANAQQFDFRQSFKPWLYRIARNSMVDRWRHLQSRPLLHTSEQDYLGASSNGLWRPDRQTESSELARHWQHALAQLPVTQREVLLLKLEADLSIQEIAAVTGSEFEACKSRLRYAIGKMRELLSEVHHD